MVTGILYDDLFCVHDTGEGHPERPERLQAVVRRLRQEGLWQRLYPVVFESADLSWIQRTHDRQYIQRLRLACDRGEPFIDTPDCAICPRSYQVAALATGGLLAAADAVIEERVHNAFCAVRPPGHHAEKNRAMGFCLLNHAAITADYLIAHHGLNRIAIVDFDVHHGNGTQHLFEHRDDVLFISLHQDPATLYPGSGYAHETGVGAGTGYTLNLPLAAGCGDEAYRQLFLKEVLPALNRFRPDAMVLSAGFDAAAQDPLAQMNVTAEGFFWISQQLVASAQRLCQGRVISTLEGGYDLDSLAHSVCRHVEALLSGT